MAVRLYLHSKQKTGLACLSNKLIVTEMLNCVKKAQKT